MQMSYVNSNTSDDGSSIGTYKYTIVWDKSIWNDGNLWYPINPTYLQEPYVPPQRTVTGEDVERLEAEIRDLRKVLTELMEILGGKVK